MGRQAGRQAVGTERSQAVGCCSRIGVGSLKEGRQDDTPGTSPLASPWGHLRGMFITRDVLLILS